MYIVLDVETTGFPCRLPGRGRAFYPFSSIDKFDSARIVSIAWIVMDENHSSVDEFYSVIRPDGFVIPESSTRIHGISNEYAVANGRPMRDVLKSLEDCFHRHHITHIVAHNIEFDMTIIKSEMYRFDQHDALALLRDPVEVCTMKETCRFMIGGKYPKLAELYEFCFDKKEMSNAHNALYDTRNCAECFAHLVRSNLLKVQVKNGSSSDGGC